MKTLIPILCLLSAATTASAQNPAGAESSNLSVTIQRDVLKQVLAETPVVADGAMREVAISEKGEITVAYRPAQLAAPGHVNGYAPDVLGTLQSGGVFKIEPKTTSAIHAKIEAFEQQVAAQKALIAELEKQLGDCRGKQP